MKTFTRAGISTSNGKTLFRFTNDLNRERVLDKNGHTNIKFFELGEAMTKEQATAFLIEQGLVEDGAAPAKVPTRKDDESILAALDAGDVRYDDATDRFVARKMEEKRESFPSFTDAQLRELVEFQMRRA